MSQRGYKGENLLTVYLTSIICMIITYYVSRFKTQYKSKGKHQEPQRRPLHGSQVYTRDPIANYSIGCVYILMISQEASSIKIGSHNSWPSDIG